MVKSKYKTIFDHHFSCLNPIYEKKNAKNRGWLRNPQLETVVSTSPIFSHFFIGFQPRWCGISQSPSATSPAPTRRRSLSSRRGRVAWAPAVSAMFGVGVNHVIGWLSCYWSWGYQYIYIISIYNYNYIYIIYIHLMVLGCS
jgi:hypothetical protein